MESKNRKLNIFLLTMMNISAVFSLNQLLLLAESGFSSIIYLGLAIIIFFIPAAFVIAELESGWAHLGGFYSWVKEAMGPKLGFLSVWLLWARSIALYIGLFWLIIGAVDLIWETNILAQPIYIFCLVFGMFFAITLLNFLGVRFAAIISAINVLAGVVAPVLIVSFFAFTWFLHGSLTEFSWPSLKTLSFTEIQYLTLLAGTMIAFAGMEISSLVSREVRDPVRSYPRSIFISLGILVFLTLMGVLALGALSAKNNLFYLASESEKLALIFCSLDNNWVAPTVLGTVSLGALGQLNSWMISTTRGIHTAINEGALPFGSANLLRKQNRFNAPIALLLVQATALSLFTTFFLSVLDFKSFFFILIVLTSQLYAMLYLLLFATAIILRYKKPDVRGKFRIPFGRIGIWFMGGMGILSGLFIITIGFFKPENLGEETSYFYYKLLTSGLVLFLGIPAVIILWKYLKDRRSKIV